MELPVAYNDKNVSFQKVESITTGNMNFYINPLYVQREIAGETFDEYEINGISVNDNSFFETIDNLCSSEGFNVEMGTPDHLITEKLLEEVRKVKRGNVLPVAEDIQTQSYSRRTTVAQSEEEDVESVISSDQRASIILPLYLSPTG